MTYLADVAALTRKDLRVELRARDTLPAMLLFVLSTLVIFHFALPEGTGDNAAYGLLWVAIVFTALLGLARAWIPEQEHGVLDGLVLAPCDRSAIWLGKTLATLAFLIAAQVVALPAFVLFFAPLDGVALAGVLLADLGICAVGSLMAAMAAATRRARAAAAAALPAARDPARRRRRRRCDLGRARAVPAAARPVRRDLRGTLVGVFRVRRHRVLSP